MNMGICSIYLSSHRSQLLGLLLTVDLGATKQLPESIEPNKDPAPRLYLDYEEILIPDNLKSSD